MLRRVAYWAALSLGLSVFYAAPAQAVPPTDMPGYQCHAIFEEENPDIQADGKDCIPINGAPTVGDIRGPFSITDGQNSYICEIGRADPPWVWGRNCQPTAQPPV
jgi:hypothetical protein